MSTSDQDQYRDSTLPLIIVNPRSAGGGTRERWSMLASDIRAHFGPFAVSFTKAPGDGAVIAERAAGSGRRLIVACGGDGTVNEVANGILAAGTDAELGIIPSGTGGDLRRTLNIPGSSRDAAVALRDGITRRIDVGKVDFLDHHGRPASRCFLNVSSFGLAASIIKRVKSQKLFDWLPIEGIRGQANFAASTLQEVLDLDPVTIKVRIDGGDETLLQTINFCVANARYFGGGMMIAPDAKLADGMFDVVNIGDISTAKIILRAYTLYRGTHTALSEVKATLAREIEVRSTDGTEILIETDGELPGKLPAKYSIIPQALKIRTPGHFSV